MTKNPKYYVRNSNIKIKHKSSIKVYLTIFKNKALCPAFNNEYTHNVQKNGLKAF